MEEENRNKHNKFINVRLLLTLSGAGCVIVLFTIVIGWIPALLKGIGSVIKAMAPIIIGCMIAFLLNPLVNKFRISFRYLYMKAFSKDNEERAKRWADISAVIISVIFFVALITGFLLILIPSLYDSINKLYENFDLYTTNTEKWVRNLAKDNPTIVNIINNYMDDIETSFRNLLADKLLPNMDSIVKAISNGIVGGLKFVLNFVIGIIAAIYILCSKDKFSAQIKKVIYAIFPKNYGNNILYACDYADSVFSGFIVGKIIDSIIIGAICFIFCRVVNMPYTVLISFIIGITNIIPFFGPFIGAIPSAFLVLVDSPKMCLVFVIFIVILQQVDGNIIGPFILGDSIGLSSFWVLFAILVGGNLFGFAGMVLGVPTFACLYALLTRLLRDALNNKGMANDTEYFVALRGFDEEGNPVRGPKKKIESVRARIKREKQLAQLKASKELIDKVTHHKNDSNNESKNDKKSENKPDKKSDKKSDKE